MAGKVPPDWYGVFFIFKDSGVCSGYFFRFYTLGLVRARNHCLYPPVCARGAAKNRHDGAWTNYVMYTCALYKLRLVALNFRLFFLLMGIVLQIIYRGVLTNYTLLPIWVLPSRFFALHVSPRDHSVITLGLLVQIQG